MLEPQQRQTIHCLHKAGESQNAISQILKLSRNTVAKVLLEGVETPLREKASPSQDLVATIKEVFARVGGNAVRIKEILQDEYQQAIHYSTLTRLIRDNCLRQRKPRSGSYCFEPGEEMQHDTSPHKVIINGKSVTAQCAALVFAYSRKLYIQYYPRFTRFEAKAFLLQALQFMDGSCSRCVIDNTSVILSGGSGANAVFAPEMEGFGRQLGFEFFAHAINHPDRKARVERPFYYAETNFLAGRTFASWEDLNRQALQWCINIANKKEKKALGMSPEAAFTQEKSFLKPLPIALPPVYEHQQRMVDSQGFVNFETNRYSVPEKLIGKTLDIYKYLDEITIYHQHRLVAKHARLIDKRYTKSVLKGNHPTLWRKEKRQAITEAEHALTSDSDTINAYVCAIKKKARGRGIRPLNKLLHLQRTYPEDAFREAVQQAQHYGLYDLSRLEDLIIQWVAGNYFNLPSGDK